MWLDTVAYHFARCRSTALVPAAMGVIETVQLWALSLTYLRLYGFGSLGAAALLSVNGLTLLSPVLQLCICAILLAAISFVFNVGRGYVQNEKLKSGDIGQVISAALYVLRKAMFLPVVHMLWTMLSSITRDQLLTMPYNLVNFFFLAFLLASVTWLVVILATVEFDLIPSESVTARADSRLDGLLVMVKVLCVVFRSDAPSALLLLTTGCSLGLLYVWMREPYFLPQVNAARFGSLLSAAVLAGITLAFETTDMNIYPAATWAVVFVSFSVGYQYMMMRQRPKAVEVGPVTTVDAVLRAVKPVYSNPSQANIAAANKLFTDAVRHYPLSIRLKIQFAAFALCYQDSSHATPLLKHARHLSGWPDEMTAVACLSKYQSDIVEEKLGEFSPTYTHDLRRARMYHRETLNRVSQFWRNLSAYRDQFAVVRMADAIHRAATAAEACYNSLQARFPLSRHVTTPYARFLWTVHHDLTAAHTLQDRMTRTDDHHGDKTNTANIDSGFREEYAAAYERSIGVIESHGAAARLRTRVFIALAIMLTCFLGVYLATKVIYEGDGRQTLSYMQAAGNCARLSQITALGARALRNATSDTSWNQATQVMHKSLEGLYGALNKLVVAQQTVPTIENVFGSRFKLARQVQNASHINIKIQRTLLEMGWEFLRRGADVARLNYTAQEDLVDSPSYEFVITHAGLVYDGCTNVTAKLTIDSAWDRPLFMTEWIAGTVCSVLVALGVAMALVSPAYKELMQESERIVELFVSLPQNVLSSMRERTEEAIELDAEDPLPGDNQEGTAREYDLRVNGRGEMHMSMNSDTSHIGGMTARGGRGVADKGGFKTPFDAVFDTRVPALVDSVRLRTFLFFGTMAVLAIIFVTSTIWCAMAGPPLAARVVASVSRQAAIQRLNVLRLELAEATDKEESAAIREQLEDTLLGAERLHYDLAFGRTACNAIGGCGQPAEEEEEYLEEHTEARPDIPTEVCLSRVDDGPECAVYASESLHFRFGEFLDRLSDLLHADNNKPKAVASAHLDGLVSDEISEALEMGARHAHHCESRRDQVLGACIIALALAFVFSLQPVLHRLSSRHAGSLALLRLLAPDIVASTPVVRDFVENGMRRVDTKGGEQAAEAQTRRAQLILQAAPDAILVMDEHGKIITANGPAEQLLGQGVVDLIGKQAEIFLPGLDASGVFEQNRVPMGSASRSNFVSLLNQPTRPLVAPGLRSVHSGPLRATRQGSFMSQMGGSQTDFFRSRDSFTTQSVAPTCEFETELRRDGEPFPIPVVISVAASTAAEGRAVVAVIHDNRDVVENRQRWESALRWTTDGIFLYDVPLNICWFSPRFLDLLGYQEGELGESMSAVIANVHEEDRSAVDTCLRVYTEHGSGDKKHSIECRMQKKDGDFVVVKFRGAAVHVDRGRVLRVAGCITDLTMFKQSEQALVKVKNAEEDAEAKRQFLANMSHEIRTPLNGVIGMARLLLNTGKLAGSQLHFATAIHHCSNQLLHIVNDILDLSKIEAGLLRLEDYTFNLHETLQETTDFCFVDCYQKGLDLGVFVSTDCPIRVNGDGKRLMQVLLNLCTNAVKFTTTGHVMITVDRIPGSPVGRETLRFAVTDTGMGITAADKSRLFVRFSQVGSNQPQQHSMGTGLGLAICKQIVELMGGQMSVESEPGAGSSFIFTVSLAVPATAGLLECPPVPGSVLTLHENKEFSRLLGNAFNKWGIEAVTATSRESVARHLNEGRFAIFILDEGKAGRNVVWATTDIAQQFPHMKIILCVSHYSMANYSRELTRVAATIYKPLTLNKVVHAVEEALSGKAVSKDPGGFPAMGGGSVDINTAMLSSAMSQDDSEVMHASVHMATPGYTPVAATSSAGTQPMAASGSTSGEVTPNLPTHHHHHPHRNVSARPDDLARAANSAASTPPTGRADDGMRASQIRQPSSGGLVSTGKPPLPPGPGAPSPASQPIVQHPTPVYVPVTAPSPTPAAPANAAPMMPAPPVVVATEAPARVLIADDSVINQILLGEMIKKFNYETETALNGVLALEMVVSAAAPFDLIFMDCQMPEMDGFVATQRIREIEKGRAYRTPIVAFTATNDSAHVQRCKDAGMDDFLNKPVIEDELSRIFKTYVEDRRKAAAAAAAAPSINEPKSTYDQLAEGIAGSARPSGRRGQRANSVTPATGLPIPSTPSSRLEQSTPVFDFSAPAVANSAHQPASSVMAGDLSMPVVPMTPKAGSDKDKHHHHKKGHKSKRPDSLKIPGDNSVPDGSITPTAESAAAAAAAASAVGSISTTSSIPPLDLNALTGAQTDEERSGEFGEQSKGRVLLVEDNIVNTVMAREMIRPLCYEVDHAGNGQISLDMLAERPNGYYDMVLMDVMMPVMDGYTATRRIREIEAGSNVHIPIVAFTAKVTQEESAKCIDSGMDDVLTKPVSDELLAAILKRWIDDKKAEKASKGEL